ncbi:MAG: transporter substrate-binding protein [Paenibacillus sp.]|jgi:multiple sugar transport system substrate-binding protein|nr:transporter substrate-binding protein [Paenibacillus sp.]
MVPFFQINGNEYMANPMDAFVKERRLAMMVGLNSQATSPLTFQGVNYDVVQLPSFPDRPGIGSAPQPLWFSISGTTPHREEAFLSIAELLTVEFQTAIARSSSYPSVMIPGLESILASDNEPMKSRNVKGLIPKKFATAPVPTLYGIAPTTVLNEAFQSVAKGEKDINTALREANEKLNKQLEERKAAGAK